MPNNILDDISLFYIYLNLLQRQMSVTSKIELIDFQSPSRGMNQESPNQLDILKNCKKLKAYSSKYNLCLI